MFGERIKKLRKSYGLTQVGLADKLDGLSPEERSHIQQLVNDIRRLKK